VSGEIERVGAAFAGARQNATGFSDYPGTLPTTLVDAYRIQDRIIAQMARPIAGWKVGRITGAQVTQLGADRLAGPIFDDHIFNANANAALGVEIPVYAQGYTAAEAEFMLRIGTTPDSTKTTYTLEEAAALIDQVCVGIEMASSPFTGINDNGAAATAADLGNSKALVIGQAISAAEGMDYINWPVSLYIEGVQQGAAAASGLPDGPIGAVRFLLELLATRGIPLMAGQWVSTGAITGVHQTQVGQSVQARFGNKYVVNCKAKAAIPIK
jgi:2-keto-4-pentenoate hydratase